MSKDEPTVKFVLRLPPSLHKKVKRLAKAEHQSMNVYIVRSMVNQTDPKWTVKSLIQRLEAKKSI